jgi:hypothetical protein
MAPSGAPRPGTASSTMSSRRALDAQGRAIVVVTTPSLWLQVGERFLVVDPFELGFTRPGRPPTARERAASARFFYDSTSAKRQRAEVPDDELDEAAAVAAAYAEQRHEPVDLIGRVAA